MEILVERGASRGDCVHKIVKKYGIYFNILKEKTIPKSFLGFIPERVEVEFCLSPRRGPALQNGDPAILSAYPGGQLRSMKNAAAMTAAIPTTVPAAMLREDTTLDFEEEKKRLIKALGKNPDQVFRQVQEQEDKEETRQILFDNQQLIFDQLKEIREKIDSKAAPKEDLSSLIRMSQLLKLNDFSERYTANLLERARKEMSLETLEDINAVQDRFLEWIGESIKIFRVHDRYEEPGYGGGIGYGDGPGYGGSRRVMVLIGPTGVGKTTTVAKLAAIYGLGNLGRGPLSVRIITIDAFRIGAVDQIRKYGDIMEIPVSYVDNRRDLRKEIDLHREETDLILVDTIGRSPGDSAKLGEMQEILDVCGSKAEMHLVLSAGTKTGDIEHTMQQFEPFNYQAVLLTKFDETRHVGNVISAMAEKDKQISYVTDGQDVPKHIKKASVVWFLTNLEEFRVDREKMEKRFPSGEADQFQWS